MVTPNYSNDKLDLPKYQIEHRKYYILSYKTFIKLHTPSFRPLEEKLWKINQYTLVWKTRQLAPQDVHF